MEVRHVCGGCGRVFNRMSMSNNYGYSARSPFFPNQHRGLGKCMYCGGAIRIVNEGQRLPGEFRLSKGRIAKAFLFTMIGWVFFSIAACWILLIIGSKWLVLSWTFEPISVVFRKWILPYSYMVSLGGALLLPLNILIAKGRNDLDETYYKNEIPIGEAVSFIPMLIFSCILTLCASIWLMPNNFPIDVELPPLWARVIIGIAQGILSGFWAHRTLFICCRNQLPESHLEDHSFWN